MTYLDHMKDPAIIKKAKEIAAWLRQIDAGQLPSSEALGGLYVIGGSERGPVKVGIAMDAAHRLVTLQIGSPKTLRLLYFTGDLHGKARKAERADAASFLLGEELLEPTFRDGLPQ